MPIFLKNIQTQRYQGYKLSTLPVMKCYPKIAGVATFFVALFVALVLRTTTYSFS